MFGIGTTELVIILVIALIIFGGKKLPDVGKGLGKAMREFRNVQKEIHSATDITSPPPSEKPSSNAKPAESEAKDKAES